MLNKLSHEKPSKIDSKITVEKSHFVRMSSVLDEKQMSTNEHFAILAMKKRNCLASVSRCLRRRCRFRKCIFAKIVSFIQTTSFSNAELYSTITSKLLCQNFDTGISLVVTIAFCSKNRLGSVLILPPATSRRWYGMRFKTTHFFFQVKHPRSIGMHRRHTRGFKFSIQT